MQSISKTHFRSTSFELEQTENKSDGEFDDVSSNLKNIFAEADATLEKAVSSSSDDLEQEVEAISDLLASKLELKAQDKIFYVETADTSIDMDFSMDLTITGTIDEVTTTPQVNKSRISLFSPMSETEGPFDATKLEGECRMNPAFLYKTTPEAMAQALDDHPNNCPDHQDDCKCHLMPTFPVFKLDTTLEDCEENEADVGQGQEVYLSPRKDSADSEDLVLNDGDFVEMPQVKKSPTKESKESGCSSLDEILNDDGNHSKKNENQDDFDSAESFASAHDESLDEDDFLPNQEGTPVQQTSSHDTDLSFDSASDSLNDSEDELDEFLPNVETTMPAAVSMEDQEQDVKIEKDKPQDASPKRRFFSRSKKNSVTDLSEGSTKAKKFPLSPTRLKSIKRTRQYSSIDSNKIDVPLKIEWSTRKELPGKNKVKEKSKRHAKSKRKLTVPKTPNLLTKEKKGQRRYSSIGKSRGDDEVEMISLLGNGIKTRKKRTLTVPKAPRLLSKEKMGEKRYSTTGISAQDMSSADKGVDAVSKKSNKKRGITHALSPKLTMSKKYGQKRYSTSGPKIQKEVEEPKKVDWSKRKITVPKTPMLSFAKSKKRVVEIETDVEVKKSQSFKARPVPDFFYYAKKPSNKKKITIPKPFNLFTEARIPSPRKERSPKENKDTENGASSFVFRAKPAPDFSKSFVAHSENKSKEKRRLTVPKPFHLRTDERANFGPTKDHTSPSGYRLHGETTPTSQDEKAIFTFKARPVPDFSKANIGTRQVKARKLTEPRPFHLETSQRAHSPRHTKENGEGAQVGKPQDFTFKARPVPDFSKPSATSKKPISVRKLTEPKPFHFETSQRIHSPKTPTSQDGKPKVFTFKAKPAPDFSKSSTQPKSSSPRKLTKPQPFQFQTDQRALVKTPTSQDIKEEVAPFKARPVPDFGQSPISGNKPKPNLVKLTEPKPFQFQTDQRALVKTPTSQDIKEEVAPFKARPVPDFGQSPISGNKPKPNLVKLTEPKPFQFQTDQRALVKTPTSQDIKEEVAPFKARPVPDFGQSPISGNKPKPNLVKLTEPKPFHFATDERATMKSPMNQETTHEEAFVFKAKPAPNFSARNPNSHRKNLVSPRALTVPVPFNLCVEDRLAERKASRVVEEPVETPSPEKRKLTVPQPFRFLTEERANIVSPRNLAPMPEPSSPSRESNVTVPRTFRLRTTERANGKDTSPANASMEIKQEKRKSPPSKRSVTIPKPFQLSESKRESAEVMDEGKEDYVFRARSVPSYDSIVDISPKSKRALTSPKPFRLSFEQKMKSFEEAKAE
ncbi:hypothetical protein CTEN210_05577 [Chaetoceros tenuissimus]|uniref:TPX2 central domain-containing protein n=1 Tax=Chaetoceros tenuissimus TaxID=426638 RepID=A0AAD3CQ67_9STRA|nr:hypothetical protein CTEN210_05577 [Chaetoceros tenuissimus]